MKSKFKGLCFLGNQNGLMYDIHFRPALILASELGYLDIVEILLNHKSNINGRGIRGRYDFLL